MPFVNYDELDEDMVNLFDEQYFIRILETAKKCECGAEKTNTTHSYWCPKYRE